MKSIVKELKVYQDAYNTCMELLEELISKNLDVFNKITSDYNISITPMGNFKDGKKLTSKELQDFVKSKEKDYINK